MLLDFYTALLLLPLFTNANVIFPVFSGAYVPQILFPIIIVVALAIEVIVFKILNRKTKIFHVLGLVIGANVVSTILGIILTIFFPSGLIKIRKGMLTSGPILMRMFFMVFLQPSYSVLLAKA